MVYDWTTELPGVFSRHADTCPARNGRPCNCGPLGYRSSVRDWTTNERILSPSFDTPAKAYAWQQEQQAALDAAHGLPADGAELGAVIDEFLEAAADGRARDGDGARYTREGVRALRGALSYVDSELGTMNVKDVERRDVQRLVDRLLVAGLEPSRVRSIVDAVRLLYAYAIRRELVGHSPIVELALPGEDAGASTEIPETPAEPAPSAPARETTEEVPAAAPPAGPAPTPSPVVDTDQPGASTTEPQAPPPRRESARGMLSGLIASPGPDAGVGDDARMQERWLWWTVRIVGVVFGLIALVLAGGFV